MRDLKHWRILRPNLAPIVNARRLNVGVTQHLLHLGDIGTVIEGSVAKFGFSRKIEFLVAIDSMTYRIPHSSKTNFATEPKKMKGDKVVAFCDRNCNVIAPLVSAPGNRNESPRMRQALPLIMQIAKAVGFSLKGTIVSLDGAYDCRNRKAIFNRRMTPNINENPRSGKTPKRGRKPLWSRRWRS